MNDMCLQVDKFKIPRGYFNKKQQICTLHNMSTTSTITVQVSNDLLGHKYWNNIIFSFHSLQHTALTHKSSKLGTSESTVKRQYKQLKEQLQTNSALVSSLWNIPLQEEHKKKKERKDLRVGYVTIGRIVTNLNDWQLLPNALPQNMWKCILCIHFSQAFHVREKALSV